MVSVLCHAKDPLIETLHVWFSSVPGPTYPGLFCSESDWVMRKRFCLLSTSPLLSFFEAALFASFFPSSVFHRSACFVVEAVIESASLFCDTAGERSWTAGCSLRVPEQTGPPPDGVPCPDWMKCAGMENVFSVSLQAQREETWVTDQTLCTVITVATESN